MLAASSCSQHRAHSLCLLLQDVVLSSHRRTVVVGVVALLSAGLVALALDGGSSLDVGTVALAVPGGGLVDGLCRGLSWPVGVELRVVACGVVSEFSRGMKLELAYPATHTCSAVVVSGVSWACRAPSAPLSPARRRGAAAEAGARWEELTLEAIVVILMV